MKRYFHHVIAILLVLSLLPVTANAQSGVKITYAGQIVDSITYNGVTVNAIYAPYTSIKGYGSDTTYCCAAFVKKFYSSVYGITVYNLLRNGGGPRVSGGNGSFYKVSTPQVGDIVHFLSNSTTHWSIVKEINGNTITVIEQNAWNNSARTDARIGKTYTVGESGVSIYRYSEASSGTPTAPAPSYTGYIKGTNGALAINSRAASGNQIGKIPEGGSCIVYPSQSSGMWYWVEYNGVSGYAYGKYISRTAPAATNTTAPAPSISKPQAPTLNIDNTKIETTGSVSLSWAQVTNATGYTLTTTDTSNNRSSNTNITKTEISIANFNAGVYKFKVCAYNSAGSSGDSNTVQLTVTEPAPIAPATPNIRISASSIKKGGTATVSWGKDSNATKYTVTIQNTKSGAEKKQSTTDTKLTLSGLDAGIYRITAFAENDTMCSTGISNALELTVTETTTTNTTSPLTPEAPNENKNLGPTATGYVVGTNGALAINDRPAPSPKNSTQIGRIPEGASCTIYTSQGTRGWYWVEYNGISGYAHKSYISTTPPTTSTKPATTPPTTTPPAVEIAPEPTMIGYVSGTNGALAINDRPAPSPKNSTQIGRIPEGASCTVYTNKGSGNWYWVEYNGVSGYVYKSYISSTPPVIPTSPSVTTPAITTPIPNAMPTEPAEPTVIGYISGTNGALAINDRPAASPKNSTQIGRIPEGASCTVYPDKGSGNWYWVEYNGVNGYAYGKYITLQ